MDLLGPVAADYQWQAREQTGFALANFDIDWETQQVCCPAGKTSHSWTPARDKHNEVIKVKFSRKDCQPCAFVKKCTRSNPARRTLTLRPQVKHEALQAGRERQKTQTFSQQYAKRAGIEGTISQGVRRCGMRRSRYRGLAKTHLQHLLTASAINMVRVMNWISGKRPGGTQYSAFIRLHIQATA